MKIMLGASNSCIQKNEQQTIIIQDAKNKLFVLESAETRVLDYLLSGGDTDDLTVEFLEVDQGSMLSFIQSLIDYEIIVPVENV